jgi:hypothetical protein
MAARANALLEMKKTGMGIRYTGILVGLLALAAAAFAPRAEAILTHDLTIGSSGSGAGQLSKPMGVDVDDDNGHLYVAEENNHRIQEFDAAGQPVRMIGYDVVQSGPGNQPMENEVQTLRIKGSSGAFSLTFSGQTTGLIPFDAPASGAGSVEAALNALANISAGGGSVSVTGGPVDVAGATPYVVTFDGGPRAGVNHPNLVVNTQHLGQPVGTELKCQLGSTPFFPYDVSWLRNGVTIPGAESLTYTTVPADEGKGIQCMATAYPEGSQVKRFFINNLPIFISTVTKEAPFPPLISTTQSQLPTPETNGPLNVGTSGQTLTCKAGTNWTNSPTSYTYEWYRNGTQLLRTETTALLEDKYVVTEADLAEPATFQCIVHAENAAGRIAQDSGTRNTVPSPSTQFVTANAIEQPNVTTVIADVEGGAVFEICDPTEDTCKAGVSGIGRGQFSFPVGVAVDDTGGPDDGTIYVQDKNNFRIQRFTQSGEFERMWGTNVNRTLGTNLCLGESSDTCQAGTSPGNSFVQGGFSWSTNHQDGNGIQLDNDGRIYVVDKPGGGFTNGGRIQRFDSDGTHLDEIRIPAGVNGTWRTLAVDPETEEMAVATLNSARILKFGPDDFSADGTTATLDYDFGTLRPGVGSVSFDPTDHFLHIGDTNNNGVACEGGSNYAIWVYNQQGDEEDCTRTSPSSSFPVAGMDITDSRKLYLADGGGHNIKVFDLPEREAPSVSETVQSITTNSGILRTFVNPNYAPADYAIEMGLAPCSEVPNPCEELDSGGPLRGTRDIAITPIQLTELTPNTTYHYRVVASNAEGETVGKDRIFTTYAKAGDLVDPCPNALARQQTKAALLLDCRAYELVSAEYAGGYDVTSDLIGGQQPFGGFPQAGDRILYSVVDGGIPGTGLPTNRGPDPYLAARGADGWSTEYVGLPSNINSSSPPFSSTLLEATGDLSTLAFGGPEICNPCFGDGSVGIPMRLPDGSIVQGMAGSLPVADPVMSGYVANHFSADGNHFIFSSEQRFEAAGNNNNGSVTIYKRDLAAGTTRVVSLTTGGATMTGPGIAALDVSADGSRVLIGREVGTDSEGNRLWDLYMHVGSATQTVLVADTPSGVQFAGMNSAGTAVLFATADPLGGDSDSSVDLYRADVFNNAATVSRVSAGSGGTGNTSACNPVANSDNADWNALTGGPTDCSIVVIGGAGGTAEGTGHTYFFSPERLDGVSNGTDGEPNLYLAAPGGSATYVTTLEADNPAVRNGVAEKEQRNTRDFQVTPAGGYAVFTTTLPLDPSYDNDGQRMIYRHDSATGDLDCVSCRPSGEPPTAAASLASNGLSVIEAGSVFFNSLDALALRDTSSKQDAYQWKDGEVQLVSTGTSSHSEGLLSATEDGKDVFFYTRATIVPTDRNGATMKIYDAREGGGIFRVPDSPPCAASDECHGPGTQAVPPDQIGTFKGEGGQFQPQDKPTRPQKCRKGFRKRRVRGKVRCVRAKSKKARRRDKSRNRGKRGTRSARSAVNHAGGIR